MKFDDILFIIQLGAAAVAAGSGNPALIAGVSAGTRLVKIGRDAYASGRERGEWTPAQEKHFDEAVLPTITSQPHWQEKT